MALLEDIGGGISNLFGGLLGGGGQPAAEGTQPGVQPQQQDLMSMLSADEQKRLAYSMLGQIGATLLAAGQKQMPQQRAQYLAQLGAIPGNVQREMTAGIQNKLLQSQLAERMQNQQTLGQITNLMKDPAAFRQTYGFDLTPGMTAAQVQNIVQQRAVSQYVNPLARQIQEAQYADMLANREKALTQLETQKQQLQAIGGDTAQIDAQIGALRRIYGTPSAGPAPVVAPAPAAPSPMLVTPAAPAAAPVVAPGGVVQPAAPAAAPTAQQPSAAPVTPPAAEVPAAPAPAEVPAAPASLFTPPAPPKTVNETAGATLFKQFTQIPQDEVRQRLRAAVTAGKFQEEYSKLLKEEREQLGEEGKRKFDQEAKLRDSFVASTKDFNNLQVAYKTMEELAQNKAGTSDLALVMSLYKIYDPGSVVSVTESGQIIGTDSAIGKFSAFANNIMTGQKLRPEIREQVLEAARSRFNENYADYERRLEQNIQLAKRNKLDPENVAIDQRDPALKAQMDMMRQRDQFTREATTEEIGGLSLAALQQMNTRVMNAKQLDAYRKRLEELGKPPAPAPAANAPSAAIPFGTTSAVSEAQGAMTTYPSRGEAIYQQRRNLAPYLLNPFGQ
jgi:hypothetical protein